MVPGETVGFMSHSKGPLHSLTLHRHSLGVPDSTNDFGSERRSSSKRTSDHGLPWRGSVSDVFSSIWLDRYAAV